MSRAARVWKSLPVSIRESQSLRTSRRHLKTFYFQSAYPLQLPTLPRISSCARPDSSKTSALHKSFIYLLTYWDNWRCKSISISYEYFETETRQLLESLYWRHPQSCCTWRCLDAMCVQLSSSRCLQHNSFTPTKFTGFFPRQQSIIYSLSWKLL